MSSASRRIADHIEKLYRLVEQLDRRVNNTFREAKVLEVDGPRGLVRVKAHDLESAWMPWAERAGTIRTWNPPAEGERVILASITGEPGQGFVLAGGFSDQFQKPHDQLGESVVRVGSAQLLMKSDAIELAVGGMKIEIKSDEIVTHGQTRLDNGNVKVTTMAGPANRVFAKT